MLWCKSWQIMIFHETLKDFPIGMLLNGENNREISPSWDKMIYHDMQWNARMKKCFNNLHILSRCITIHTEMQITIQRGWVWPMGSDYYILIKFWRFHKVYLAELVPLENLVDQTKDGLNEFGMYTSAGIWPGFSKLTPVTACRGIFWECNFDDNWI